jgi:hypothetical protein
MPHVVLLGVCIESNDLARTDSGYLLQPGAVIT